jgi:hypothetical protein
VFGGALDFDGDDYVDCGNPSLLDFGPGSWSIAAWIKMSSTTDNMNIFANGGDNSGGIRYMLGVSETTDHKLCLTLDDNADKRQRTGSISVDDGDWHHVVGMRDASELRVYVDRVQDGGTTSLADGYDLSGTSQANAYIGAGWNLPDSLLDKFFIGTIDDVRIYDYALSEAEIQAIGTPLKASEPSPAEGTVLEQKFTLLEWMAGATAASYDVYVSDNLDDVTGGAEAAFAGNQTETSLSVGMAGVPIPDGLVPGSTYYWRVDAVEADPNVVHEGEVWSFSVMSEKAYSPNPADGAVDVATDAQLSWPPERFRCRF